MKPPGSPPAEGFRRHPAAALVFLALLLAGCAGTQPWEKPAPAVVTERKLPLRVAVLPFVNRTPNPEAAGILRKMFFNFFSSLNYLDQEPFLVDAALARHDLKAAVEAGTPPPVLQLGQALGVEAVIFGEVTSLGKLYALVYAHHQAGLRARMVDCATGETIWAMEHTVFLREGEVPTSLPGLAAAIIKTAYSHQQDTLNEAAAALSMQMVATIPNPPPVSEPPPKIHALVHNAGERLLRPGEVLKIVLVGDRGRRASWSLAPLVAEAPLAEAEPGVYIGTYRVKDSDVVARGRIIGRLQADGGAATQWIDTLGEVRIGAPTPLPPLVEADTLLTAARGPYLVEDVLVVAPGARLTVEAGSVLWFERLGLVVKGELRLLGTAEAPVTLAGVGEALWKGIFFDHSTGDNLLRHAVVSGAQYGLRAAASRVTLTGCRLEDNAWGMVIEEGRAAVSRSLFRNAAKIAVAARDAELTLTESTVTENRAGGVLIEGGRAAITASNIANNGRWQLKVLGDKARVSADGNWWGRRQPTAEDVVGAVQLGEVLPQPLAY